MEVETLREWARFHLNPHPLNSEGAAPRSRFAHKYCAEAEPKPRVYCPRTVATAEPAESRPRAAGWAFGRAGSDEAADGCNTTRTPLGLSSAVPNSSGYESGSILHLECGRNAPLFRWFAGETAW